MCQSYVPFDAFLYALREVFSIHWSRRNEKWKLRIIDWYPYFSHCSSFTCSLVCLVACVVCVIRNARSIPFVFISMSHRNLSLFSFSALHLCWCCRRRCRRCRRSFFFREPWAFRSHKLFVCVCASWSFRTFPFTFIRSVSIIQWQLASLWNRIQFICTFPCGTENTVQTIRRRVRGKLSILRENEERIKMEKYSLHASLQTSS